MKIEISEMWILWKIRFQKCEFCEKWDFENVNFAKNKNLSMYILWKNVPFAPLIHWSLGSLRAFPIPLEKDLCFLCINISHKWVIPTSAATPKLPEISRLLNIINYLMAEKEEKKPSGGVKQHHEEHREEAEWHQKGTVFENPSKNSHFCRYESISLENLGWKVFAPWKLFWILGDSCDTVNNQNWQEFKRNYKGQKSITKGFFRN